MLTGNDIAVIIGLPLRLRRALHERGMRDNLACHSGWRGCTSMDSDEEQWVHEDVRAHPLSTIAGSMFQDSKRKRIRAYVVPVDTAAILAMVAEHHGVVTLQYEPVENPSSCWIAQTSAHQIICGSTALSAALKLYQAVASP